tara:strand:+ start:1789 stop:2820 length:1032 start_codon:yes stop_codon:yes gene_type:complete
MVLLTRKTVIEWATEANGTPGTANTSSMESAPCYDISFTPEVTMLTRDPGRATLSKEVLDIAGRQAAKLTFATDFVGTADGSGEDNGKLGPLWIGCGAIASDGGTQRIFAPSSVPHGGGSTPGTDSHGTTTFRIYHDGRMFTMSGSAGTMRVLWRAGELPRIEWDFTGMLSAIDGQQTMLTTSYDDVTPKAVGQSDFLSLVFDGTSTQTLTPKATEVVFDMANTVNYLDSVNSATGVAHAVITDRAPTLTFDAEAVATGTEANHALTMLTNADKAAVTLKHDTGGGNGNACQFTAPEAQLVNLTYGDRNGVITENYTMRLCSASTGSGTSDDEWKFEWQSANF